MAISEKLTLDLTEAQRQVDALEAQLDALSLPITIPVQVDTGELDALRREIAATDATDVDVDVDASGISAAEGEMEDLRQEVDRTGDEFVTLDRRADDATDAVLRVGTQGTSVFTNLRGSLLGVGAAFGAIAAGRAFLTFADQAIDAASDFEESLSKTGVVFGDFAGQIQEFATTAPENLGLSTAAALEMTSTFGNLFVALGLSQQAAAELGPDIVQLGADLASFNNIEVTDALEKLRSGLVGEAEPLRVLGVNINAAVVEAKALELGLVDATGAVTEAGKVQARYALIVEQTATAQGDFARTADGIANTQRTLAAEFENSKTALGNALLPAYEALLGIVPSVIEGMENLEPAVRAVSLGFADAAEDADGFIADIARLAAVAPTVGSGFGDIAAGLGSVFALFAPGESGIFGDFTAIDQGLQGINEGLDKIAGGQRLEGLVQSLQQGVDPAEALEASLKDLATVNLNPGNLEKFAGVFASVADVSPRELIQLIDTIEAAGEAGELTAEQVGELVGGLDDLFTAPTIDFAQETADLRNFGSALPEVAEGADADAIALRGLEDAARSMGIPLADLVANIGELPPELQSLIDSLTPTGQAFLDQIVHLDDFEAAITDLPNALEAAGRAFEDETGEIESTLTGFIDNIAAELRAQRAFQTNLDLLRSFGLDDMAALFEAEGIDAADKLAKAVANPARIAESEALLDAGYRGVAQSVVDAMVGVIDGDTTFTLAMIGLVAEAQSQVGTIVVPVTLDDEVIIPPNLIEGIDVGTVVIPVTTGEPSGGGGGGDGGGTVTPPPNLFEGATAGAAVVQNFFTQPSPTTETARAAQTAAAVLAAKAK